MIHIFQKNLEIILIPHNYTYVQWSSRSTCSKTVLQHNTAITLHGSRCGVRGVKDLSVSPPVILMLIEAIYASFLCPCDQQQTSVNCWGAASRARCITFLPTGTQSVSVVSQVANISSPYISVCGFQFPNHKSGYNKTWQRDCLLPARPTSLAASEFVGCILWRTHFTEMSPLQTTKSEVIDVK